MKRESPFDMMRIKASTLDYQSHSVDLPLPDECPLCHQSIVPRIVTPDPTLIEQPENRVELVFRCPSQDCSRLFLATYAATPSTGEYVIRGIAPQSFQPPPIPEDVARISPAFKKLYGQASEAENRGLDEVAGVGYRQALEFLVKDYCIHKWPDEKDAIAEGSLGKCIRERVDDNRVKQCATHALWPENGEGNYFRRSSNQDIHDLKVLIQLCVKWVSSSLLAEDSNTDMPP